MLTRLAVGVFVAVAIVAAGQDCKDFIVQDTASIQTNQQVYQKLQDTLCSEQLQDKGSAQSAGVKAGIPIPVLDAVFDLTLQGTYKSDDWSHWKSAFCHSNYNELATSFANKQLYTVFSDNSRKIVEACLQHGLYGYYDLKAGRTQFSFQAKYHPQATETWNLERAEIKPAAAVTGCSASDPFGLAGKGRDLRKQVSVTCSWDSTQPVTISLRTDQGDVAYPLPAMPPRKIIVDGTPKIERVLHPAGFRHAHSSEGPSPGCACGPAISTSLPDGTSTKAIYGRIDEPIVFRWDAAWICRGQGIKQTKDGAYGHIYWDGQNSDALPDSYGTVEVTYNTAGSHIVKLDYNATCVDYGAAHCENFCQTSEDLTITVK